MKNFFILTVLLLMAAFSIAQSFPTPVVSSVTQNFRQTPNGTILTTVPSGNKLVASSVTPDAWYLTFKPSATNSNNFGYVKAGSGYFNSASNTPFLRVQNTGSTGLNVRTGAGTNYSQVTLSGQNAKIWDTHYFATTGNSQVVNGSTWFQIYLTNDCSQTSGWVSNGVGSGFNYLQYFPGTQNTFSISTSSSPPAGGTTAGGGTYTINSTVSVSAFANSGYAFYRWEENGTAVSTSATYNFTISSNRSLVAKFIATVTNYTINTSTNPTSGGNTTGGGTYGTGSSATVSASANPGYLFYRWEENGTAVSTSSTYNFTVTANRLLVAKFNTTVNNYTISISSNPTAGGTTNGDGTYATGSTATVTALANSGYAFYRWEENGVVVSTNASYSFTVNGNRSLVAIFNTVSTNNYTISTSSNPTNGGNTTGSGTYAPGNAATVIALPNLGFVFYRWEENGVVVSTNSSYSFVVNGNRSLVAKFNVVSAYPNLTITGINSSVNSIVPGGATLISYNLVNNQANPGGGSVTAFHLSSTPTYINGNALWLDEDNCPAIGSSSSLTRIASIPIPSNTQPGSYYIIASADAMGTLTESNENDNRNYVAIAVINVITQADTYPWRNSSNSVCLNSNCESDSYGFCRHWCTSYVAWKVNEFFGRTSTSLPTADYPFNNYMTGGTQVPTSCSSTGSQYRLGNACHWDEALTVMGISVNTTPAVGAIAHWNENEPGVGSAGHVAFVNEVYANGNILISEYNWTPSCVYNTRVINMNQPSVPGNRKPGRFIHVEASGIGSGGNAFGVTNSFASIFKVFPNPTSGKFKFEFHSEQAGQTSLLVFSADSRLLKTENIVFTQGTNSFERDYQQFSPGIYVLVAYIAEQRYIGKLILYR